MDQYNNILRRVNLSSGLVTTLAGRTSGTVGSNNNGYADGVGTAAAFHKPTGIIVDGAMTFAVIVRCAKSRWACFALRELQSVNVLPVLIVS